MPSSADHSNRLAKFPQLHIEGWRDELVEAHGYDPRSDYARLFWLPQVGPSALVAAAALMGV
jgi:hypothetical protein